MLIYPDDCENEAAVDEVGRGCLAFEVCAAAVVFPRWNPDDLRSDELRALESIKDSKRLSKMKRDALANFIKTFALAYGVGMSSPAEIDALNILNATHVAMHRALDALSARRSFNNVLVDGDKFCPYFPPFTPSPTSTSSSSDVNAEGGWLRHRCVPGADSKYIHVAAASILAKTHRDALVDSYCDADSSLQIRYDIRNNKAYGTPRHMSGLKAHGATPFHRRSFAPVRAAIEAVNNADIFRRCM